jgi:hypothetical protein
LGANILRKGKISPAFSTNTLLLAFCDEREREEKERGRGEERGKGRVGG